MELLDTGHRGLDCFTMVSRAILNAASIEVSRASAMWRAIQINSQQPRQKNLLLGTVPGGDGISFSPQTQHFKTGFSDSKVQAFIFPHHRKLAKAMRRLKRIAHAAPESFGNRRGEVAEAVTTLTTATGRRCGPVSTSGQSPSHCRAPETR